MATRKLEVVITGDASSLERALGKAGNQSRSFAKTMGKAGVAGALVGLGAAVKVGVGEFMEAQKVTAQTNAVLKSTGAVANVTTGEVQKLSASLLKKSGVDDEAIQSGQNMLLTFTKIRNETGKGNDVFNQATKATLNLSVAMGKDMQGSALLLGKALNDPIKGMASLGRAGVQFTEEQKDTIKALIEGATAARALSTVIDEKLTPAQYKSALEMEKQGMGIEAIAKKLNVEFTPAQMRAAQELQRGGETMKAQKIILKELETQFGGSAEAAGKTLAGQLNIARESFKNMTAQMVVGVMPAFNSFVAVVIKATAWMSEHETATKAIIGGLVALTAVVGAVTIATKLWTAATTIATAAQWAWNAAMNANPISLIVIALAALGVALVVAYKKSETFRKIVDGVFTTVKDSAAAVNREIGEFVDDVKWLIAHIPDIPKLPSMPSINNNPTDPFHLVPKGDANLMGASSVMAPFAANAAGYGLSVTSGLRPGAITANGTPSDHGIGKAIDVAGSSAGMAGFFRSLIGNRSVKQAFYDPLGSIFGGALNSYREGGHSDHVHVATYDKGGMLMPGWTMAYNGTGRPEQVGGGGGGGPYYLVLPDGKILAELVRKEGAIYQRSNGPVLAV